MELKGSLTEQNLLKAIQGESEAFLRYTIFGHEAEPKVLEELYATTAKNEREHAEEFMELLGYVKTDEENLRICIMNETMENKIIYAEMACIAREEGFEEIAKKFELVAAIEGTHRDNYEKILRELETKTLFKKNQKQQWLCSNCGTIVEGLEAPLECPFCEHDQKYFTIKK
ncbi:MAG: ferritin family protein [Cellulosilyticaceae bacterium]